MFVVVLPGFKVNSFLMAIPCCEKKRMKENGTWQGFCFSGFSRKVLTSLTTRKISYEPAVETPLGAAVLTYLSQLQVHR